ncbi:transcriptional regulator, LuxR family [Truepera radiovictrix DSM 17093]|uniref:Transcriptional regulator, LuxR family n=1 Tax=Truepera radiovictrix (strain DSM 17093 / CIP 108686 / LMG 22925 / RQ-24) TaxID=649638 RepID=D7CVH4_TRURR|nr:transcriptional regulator, LuxR family [Truepera radiovictrix DSM 17093]
MRIYADTSATRARVAALLAARPPARPLTLIVDDRPGYALAQLIAVARSSAPTLVVTANRSPFYLHDLLGFGPQGLAVVGREPVDFADLAQRVARGETFYEGPPLPPDPLTERERTVLRLLATGHTNAAIARRLGLSGGRVSNLVMSVREKVGVENRVQLALAYFDLLSLWQEMLAGA